MPDHQLSQQHGGLSSRSSRKRPPSSDNDASDAAEFDYEAERPQKVPLLSATEEALRNLLLLDKMGLKTRAPEQQTTTTEGVVDFPDGVEADETAQHQSIKSKKRDRKKSADATIAQTTLSSADPEVQEDKDGSHRKDKRQRRDMINKKTKKNGDCGVLSNGLEPTVDTEILNCQSSTVPSNSADHDEEDKKKEKRHKDKKKNALVDGSVPSNGTELHEPVMQHKEKTKKNKGDRVPSIGLESCVVKAEDSRSKKLARETVGVPSNSASEIGINRPETGGGQFAFAFDFGGGGELDLDAEIVESADVEFPAAAAAAAEEDTVHLDAENSKRKRGAVHAMAAAAEFHPFCASVQPGLDFFAARPDPEDEDFLDGWRRERDFIKEDVVRTAKRAAAAKKQGGVRRARTAK